MMLYERLDGCSLGSEAVVYKPMGLDGQRLISINISARTLQLSVNIGGTKDGRYSRSEALKSMDEVRKVFIPGQGGTLTWTDSENSRFIRCRCTEAPLPEEILPFLFRAVFPFVADDPMWYDSTENIVTFESGNEMVVNNDCGVAVPFLLQVTAASDQFVVGNAATGAGIGFSNTIGEGFIIDTAACTVTSDSGELVNHLLNIDSEFFYLVPGENRLVFVGADDVVLKWRKAYTGVY